MALRESAIPLDRQSNSVRERQARAPSKTRTGFRAVELQDMGFRNALRRRMRAQLRGTGAPRVTYRKRQCLHVHRRVLIGTEIPAFRKTSAAVGQKMSGQRQIT